MASKAPKTEAVETPVVKIDIAPTDRESHDLVLDGQTSSYTAVKPNVLTQKAALVVAPVNTMVINDPAALIAAHDVLRNLKGTRNGLEDMRKAVSEPLHKAWTANNANFKPPIELIDAAIVKVGRLIVAYEDKVEREAEEARRKAAAEAEAERQRVAAKARETEEAAAQAAMTGDVEKAETLFQKAEAQEMEAAVIVPRHVETFSTKVAGSSRVTRWSAELPESKDGKLAALKYIVANPQYLNLVDFNQTACNQLAVALKENLAIPGIKAVSNATVASRGVAARSL